MVENPDQDETDPDSWEQFFSQFGEVAYVTVSKNNEVGEIFIHEKGARARLPRAT